MKTLYIVMAIMLIVTSCRAGADIFIVQRILIDENELIRLLSKPRPKPKIKVEDRFLNCKLMDRIAWALLTQSSIDQATVKQ